MSSTAATPNRPNQDVSGAALAASSIGTGVLKVGRLFDVSGWVAVVTGGGTGLGLTTAAALAENGARVYICGRRKEQLEAAAATASPKDGKGEIIAVQADVATKEGIMKLRTAIEAKEKFINILVNNHGVSLEHADIDGVEQTPAALSAEMFENESFDNWLNAYRINTASYYFTSWALLPLLCAARDFGGFPEPGNIVNISSMSGITVTSQRGQFSYNASKAATISLNDQLATEFARRNLGVRVNAICPGYFPSGMSVFSPEQIASSDENRKQFRTHMGVPFARPGNAVDYAQCIFGVVTNQYQTGSHIVIDGGWLLEQQF